MMKKLFPLLILALILITSCEDEDDNTNAQAQMGQWETTELYYSGTSTTGGYTTSYYGEATQLNSMYLTFNSNGTYEASGDYVIELTSTYFGQTVTTTHALDFANLVSDGTWERNGNILTFTSNGQTTTYNVSNETSTYMNLDGQANVYQGGTTALVDMHMTLEK